MDKPVQLKIKLKDGKEICAEVYSYDGEHEELSVYIQDEDGNIIQDIALVRPSESEDKKVEVLVWKDKDDEDYTDKFSVDVAPGPEEWVDWEDKMEGDKKKS